MIPNILHIARREFIETIYTKAFILGLLLTPLIIIGVGFFAGRSSRIGSEPQAARTIMFLDQTEQLAPDIESSFQEYNESHGDRQIHVQAISADGNAEAVIQEQQKQVREGKIDGFLVIPEHVIEGEGTIPFYIKQIKVSQLTFSDLVQSQLQRAIVQRRCKIRNISPELLGELRKRVPLEEIDLSQSAKKKTDKETKIMNMMVPFFFMYLMFMGIFGSSQQMLTSVIEEKNSRVMEVLLSALSPFELMAGKIVGLSAIGLVMVTLWGGGAYGAAMWKGMNIPISAGHFALFAGYYILGYILFCSVLAGIGSICNTVKEAQGLMMPLTLIYIFPLIGWMNLVQHPYGVLARVLSYIPPLTPMVMILRYSADPELSPWEIAATILLLILCVPLVMGLSAKVFQTGILMYGKKPGLFEVFRWLRQR